MSVVKINVLTVPAEQREVLEKRFASRAHAVENSDGFEWFELLRPVEGTDTYLVYTRWRDEESFQAWMEGPMKSAHQGGGEGGERPKPAASGSTPVVLRGGAAGRSQERVARTTAPPACAGQGAPSSRRELVHRLRPGVTSPAPAPACSRSPPRPPGRPAS